MSKEEKKEKVDSVIIAVYKTNLHCPKCAHDIKRPLLKIPGVHSVEAKHETGEITVKGTFDAKKMHERIEKISRKKVVKVKEESEKIVKDTKKETIRTTKIKAYMHCDQCERDLRMKLLRNKGIHDVKTDIKAQTITIEGTVESEKILTFMKKRVHKHAEIIQEKKKEEKKKEEEKKEKVTVEVKTKETKEIIEFKEEKKVEAKTKEGNTPYFIHYVYAPQMFSDENPNACSIM